MFATVRVQHYWGHAERDEKWSVRRRDLVDEALDHFGCLTPAQLRAGLRVHFMGEDGVDTGGVLTEMYTVFFSEVTNPQHGLFESRADGTVHRMTSMSGSSVSDHAGYLPAINADTKKLEALGKIAVKCVYDGRRLGASFAPCVFKFIAGVDPDLRDLELYDPTTARSLRWLLVNAGGGEAAMVTFAGLTPDGEATAVNDDNKHEYVRLKVKDILVQQRWKQLQAMKRGFTRALRALSEQAQPFLCLLSHSDWRLLFCGQEYVNSAHVISCLRFQGYEEKPKDKAGHDQDQENKENTDNKSPTPEWLRDILGSLSDDNVRRFLIFVTSSPSLPAPQLGSAVIRIRRWEQSPPPSGTAAEGGGGGGGGGVGGGGGSAAESKTHGSGSHTAPQLSPPRGYAAAVAATAAVAGSGSGPGVAGPGGEAKTGEGGPSPASPQRHAEETRLSAAPLPRAHSCFNILDLPEYDSQRTLEGKLLQAMEYCGLGFGLE